MNGASYEQVPLMLTLMKQTTISSNKLVTVKVSTSPDAQLKIRKIKTCVLKKTIPLSLLVVEKNAKNYFFTLFLSPNAYLVGDRCLSRLDKLFA